MNNEIVLYKAVSIENPKIDQSEFNRLATKIFENISKSYSQSWHSRPLKDEEFPDEKICDKCTGCGTFKNGEFQSDCSQDREQGWCYHRYRDAEEFGIEVEAELDNIHGLLGIDIIPDNPQPLHNHVPISVERLEALEKCAKVLEDCIMSGRLHGNRPLLKIADETLSNLSTIK